MSCLLVFCGLPGSGKTSLCHFLKTSPCLNEMYQVEHVSFDSFFQRRMGDKPFDLDEWHRSRQDAFNAIEKCFEKFKGQPLIVLADDNMYYRSMRKQCFKIARDRGCGLLDIYLRVPLEVAMKRNALREASTTVPEDVLTRMNEVLEPPLDGEHGKNSRVLTLEFPFDLDAVTGDRIRLALSKAIETPLVDTRRPEREYILSKEETAKNVLHQTDIALRKLIKETIQEQKAENKDVRQAAKELAFMKRQFLGELKANVELLDAWGERSTLEIVGQLLVKFKDQYGLK